MLCQYHLLHDSGNMSSFLVIWVPGAEKAIVHHYGSVSKRPVVIGYNKLSSVGLPVFIVAIEGNYYSKYSLDIYCYLEFRQIFGGNK